MADTLNLEAERAAFEAEILKLNPDISLERWPAGHYKHNAVDGHWRGWQLCRAATKAEAPADAPTGIPRESNDALIALARFWKLDGDWMTCKGCKRSLIASRDGEELNHASGCKFADQQHPWAQLRALIARRASSVPAIPGTGREKEWISVTDKLPDPNGTYLVASNWGVRAAYLHDPAWAQGCWQDALSKTDEGEMDFDYKQKGRFKVTHWMPLPDAPSHPSEAKAGEDA